MSSSQNVQVCVRIRPLTANELLADAAECVFTMDDKPVVAVGLGSSAQGKRSFTFDNVLGTVSTQDELYESCVSPLMKKFQEGYNATIVAYGQTGSGKTFSMGTGLAIEESIGNEGIVPRFIRRLFEHLNFKTDANPNGYKSSVSVTFLELYNEELIDLLNPRPQSASEAGWGGLSIREDGNGNIVWTGVREETVANREELMQCLQKGSLCRTTGSTDMNASSSRSHAIFTIILKQEVWMPKGYSNGNILSFDNNEQFNPTNAAAGGWSTFNSKFHFVDLAGSERLKRTNAAGGRKKEGISINQGLLSLGNVISALGDENRKDSLGGNSQTLMLACVSPSNTNYGETISTLQYANRARNIKNTVSVNQVMAAAQTGSQEREIVQLRALVAKLQADLALYQSGGENPSESSSALKESLPGDKKRAPGPNNSGLVSNGVSSISQADLESERSRANDNTLWLERQIQQHVSREQELEAQVLELQNKLKSRDFEIEKLYFYQHRLYERSKDLGRELTNSLVERDQVLSRYLNQTENPSRIGDESEDTESSAVHGKDVPNRKTSGERSAAPSAVSGGWLSRTPNPTTEVDNTDSEGQTTFETSLSTRGYLNAIAQLRFQLADTDDKLRWYKNVFETLGSSRSSSSVAPNLLGEMIAMYPQEKDVKRIVDESEPDVDSKNERRLFRALREDRELNKMLEKGDPSLDRKGASILSAVGSTSTDELPVDVLPPIKPTEDVDNQKIDSSYNRMRSSSLYILVDKIQSDISENEQMVSRLQQREAEYEAMKNVFEQKLSGLKVQLVQVQRERDMAMQRIRGDNLLPKEKAGTIAVKNRFDKKHKQLEQEISDLRGKLSMRTNSKTQNATLTKNLMATIQSLKAEKSNMTRKLKIEADKNRELALAKEKELEKMRMRERKSDEKLRKLQRAAVSTKGLNTARPVQMGSGRIGLTQGAPSQMNMKNVMSILRRTSSAANMKKTSPPQKSTNGTQEEASTRLGVPIGSIDLSDDNDTLQGPPVDVRAQFKKQMLERELESCIRQKRVMFKVEELKETSTRLLAEQKELLAERERCIEHDLARGLAQQESYYMDERLDSIDLETAMITSRISDLRVQLTVMSGEAVQEDSSANSIQEQKESISKLEHDAFENADNILKSLDEEEIQLVAAMLMKEAVEFRVHGIEKDMKLAEREKMLVELRAVLETVRLAALKTSMQFEAKIAEIQDDAKKVVEKAVGRGATPDTMMVPARNIAAYSDHQRLNISPDQRLNHAHREGGDGCSEPRGSPLPHSTPASSPVPPSMFRASPTPPPARLDAAAARPGAKSRSMVNMPSRGLSPLPDLSNMSAGYNAAQRADANANSWEQQHGYDAAHRVPADADANNIWERYGNDPEIVAQAVVNTALSVGHSPGGANRGGGRPAKTMEELKASIGSMKRDAGPQRRTSRRRRPPRPQSAPLIPPIDGAVAMSSSSSSSQSSIPPIDGAVAMSSQSSIPPIDGAVALSSSSSSVPSRNASRSPTRKKILRSPSPVTMLKPIPTSVISAAGKRVSASEDARIWQEALHSLHTLGNGASGEAAPVPDDGASSPTTKSETIFERLASKHTIASWIKK